MKQRLPLLLAALLVVAPVLLASLRPALAATVTITPGTVWTDTAGRVIQAHGEGVTKVGDTFYWLGEDKTNGSPFQNVTCYSSTDLKTWTFVGNVLTRQASGDLGPGRVVERPHVVYNRTTATYVMYLHIDNASYAERRAGVATSASICGSYTYRGSFKPLGHDSLDDNLFLDGDTAYFMSEDRTSAKLQIYQLSADFLSVSSLVATLNQYESPAMVKIGGTYYLFGSHLTGWSTNDNQVATAPSIAGPWSSWRSFAPSGSNTCNAQTTAILPVATGSGTSYVFLGDRWNAGNLADSRYVWQPLTINGTTVSMTCQSSWTIDVASGPPSPPASGSPSRSPGAPSGGASSQPPGQAGTCTAGYEVSSQWSGGFGGVVTVRNSGAAPIDGWVVSWTFTDGQTITQLWNGSYTQSGATVTVRNLTYNATVAAGGSTAFGFNGTWTAGNTPPVVACASP